MTTLAILLFMNSKTDISFHIGILSAMPEEVGHTILNLKNVIKAKYGDLTIYSGEWISANYLNKPIFVTVAWSGWGKVSSSRAATRIISTLYKEKKIDFIIFTGVAGGIKKDLKQWDIVIPHELIQYDMDARPIFKRFILPALNIDKIKTDPKILNWANKVVREKLDKKELPFYKNLYNGLIGTGDQFVANKSSIDNLKSILPEIFAVEMEGAAVAQVAHQEKIPCLIVRVISDNADDEASLNFNEFLKLYQKYSWDLIKIFLDNLDSKSLQI